jgi:hypothetical protein
MCAQHKQVTRAVRPHIHPPSPDATFDTGGVAGPPPEAVEQHEGAKEAPHRKKEGLDSRTTAEGALDGASSLRPQEERSNQVQVEQVVANARDAVQRLASHLQRSASGGVGHDGAIHDAAILKSIPSSDVNECRRFQVRLLATR